MYDELEQLEFKQEKIIGFQKRAGKVRKRCDLTNNYFLLFLFQGMFAQEIASWQMVVATKILPRAQNSAAMAAKTLRDVVELLNFASHVA